jgi:hypothetical protein
LDSGSNNPRSTNDAKNSIDPAATNNRKMQRQTEPLFLVYAGLAFDRVDPPAKLILRFSSLLLLFDGLLFRHMHDGYALPLTNLGAAKGERKSCRSSNTSFERTVRALCGRVYLLIASTGFSVGFPMY